MSTTKKILVPLATLAAAGAIAIGSGATFTSTTANSLSSVTAGTLKQTNSKDNQAIFDLNDIKPGDVLDGTLTLTNSGTLPAEFSLTETASTSTFSADVLSLTISDDEGTEVYAGTFGGLEDGTKNALGAFAAGEARTYTFTVALDEDATNAEQGKKATAAYRWDAVQVKGSAGR